jgi:hypothetical protein
VDTTRNASGEDPEPLNGQLVGTIRMGDSTTTSECFPSRSLPQNGAQSEDCAHSQCWVHACRDDMEANLQTRRSMRGSQNAILRESTFPRCPPSRGIGQVSEVTAAIEALTTL